MPIGSGIKLKLLALIVTFFLSPGAFAAGVEPALTLEAEFTWEEPAKWFGGLSGVEMSDNGQNMIIVTDRGQLITAKVQREAGVLVSIDIKQSVELRDEKGRILVKPFTDAEGLASSKDGQIFLSFEGQHRITTVDVSTGVTEPVAFFPKDTFQSENGGLEAIAVSPDGTVMAIPEDTGTGSFPLFALRPGKWEVAAEIPKRGPFLPVGADFDGNGLLYILERAVTPLGFRSRIRRFDLSTSPAKEVTLMQSLPSRFDNLEAISVWQDGSGKTHLTLISDDNFLPIQKTQIVEFSVGD